MAVQEIGFYGGMALLISSITGPGLTTIPLLYQEAGWLTPTLAFLLFGSLAAIVSLFLVETMSTIRGNEDFQARVEFSTVAHLYLGDRAHIAMQVLLYCALQSVNISSIIISEQTMDSILIHLFQKTCALSFTEGWICVKQLGPSGSVFDSYILFSLGYLIAAVMVLPLSVMSLVQNIKFQLLSVASLFLVMIVWVFLFADHGLNLSTPVVGRNQSALIGFVLSNFAFITTVPSFVNELSRRASIHRSITYPIVVCVALYIIIGLTGAASFRIDPSSDLLATLGAADKNKTLITIANILFPISVLVTSVPVFAIVIRYNLVRGNLCSNRWAIIWASLAPWLLIIPFQTKGWLIQVMNWSSLIFGSSTNFIIPLILYISSKTHAASTIDTLGGDIFVLHRGDSRTSDQRRSSSRRRSFAPDVIPRLTTTLADEENSISAYEASSSPVVVVTSPTDLPRASSSASRKSGEEIDITDLDHEASQPGLDPLSIPLRVVYSPAVSRNPSIGHGSHRASNADVPSESTESILPPSHLGATSPSLEAPRVSNEQVLRRRSSTTGDGSRTSYEPHEPHNRPHSYRVEDSSSHEPHTEDVITHNIFKAFRERKWLREIIVAKVYLAVVTCCVLGNLVYTIVETAKGNSPLSS